MRSSEVRSSFLEFFARNAHRIVPSSPLVPADDPTLLFTNAGMNQFKDVFLGKERRDYTRAASSQKCMRVSGKHNDLENVGPSLRHHTFFEMLGNFSFGDYFKADAIALAWTLLTQEWKLPADRLRATIFGGEGSVPRDDEAGGIWRQFLPPDRIAELGLADNFWSMGDTGPCGRCSEIHYFRGDDLPCPEPVCLGVACSCDRFVEVWNNVFMEFDRHANGSLAPLPAPSIDTGMGLERATAVLQGVLSNYDTDLFTPLLAALGDLARVRYGGTMSPGDISMRVVADHTRAMTFLIGDGVVPSNEWRGYVLRKIMRRAMRHGKRLGMTEPFLFKLVDVLAREMGAAYGELQRQRAYIEQLIRSEEERFESVLVSGLPRLEDVLERAAASLRGVVPGDEAFRLYDTYGVPRDFIEDLASERHLALDLEGFERAMEGQREKARAQSTFGGAKAESLVLPPEAADRLRAAGDHFEGYATTRVAGVPIVAVLDERGQVVPELGEGDTGYLALARTPFYAESGGQVSDSGRIFTESGSGNATLEAIARLASDQARLHRVRVTAGVLRERDLVTAEVDRELRDATRRNHTGTHLLHAALRRVLGRHVKQAGSLVAPDRLRFDFLHFAAVSRDDLDQIERLVNEQIYLNTPVETEVRATEEAIAAGAMALFGEKYGDRVRVVSVPGFSLELCGGTHCRSTGDIGLLTIVQEGGIAAGTRRIEALTGAAAVRHHQQQRRVLAGILQTLNTPADQAVEVIEHLEAEVKRLGRENSQLKVKLAMGRSALEEAGSTDTAKVGLRPAEESIGGAKVHVERVDGLDKASLRSLADSHRDRLKSGVVVLASADAGKVVIVVSVTKDLTSRVHAGEIVKLIAPIVGGGGGGRPDFAEAGGRNPEKIGELLDESRRLLRRALEA
jgi:alanyl-tRNA synthetase